MTGTLEDVGRRAVAASRELAVASTSQKDQALLDAADLLEVRCSDVLEANRSDVSGATEKGASDTELDRLRLTEAAGRVYGIGTAHDRRIG